MISLFINKNKHVKISEIHGNFPDLKILVFSRSPGTGIPGSVISVCE